MAYKVMFTATHNSNKILNSFKTNINKLSQLSKINLSTLPLKKIKMYKSSVTNLATLDKPQIQKFLDSFDTVLTDCDGVLWLQNEVIPGSPQVLNKLRALGKKVFYVTNNSTKKRQDFVVKAKRLEFVTEENEMISTGYLTADYLKSQGVKKAYVVGSKGITAELDRVGIEHTGVGPDVLEGSVADLTAHFQPDDTIDAVVVGYDEHISYPKLFRAGNYLQREGCLFVATNTDRCFPGGGGVLIPGTGVIVQAVTALAGRQPVVIGKPSARMVEKLMRDEGVVAARTLMIGDRCDTDILLGTNCGFQTLLVLTGVTKLEEVATWQKSDQKELHDLVPDMYLDKLGDLLPFLE